MRQIFTKDNFHSNIFFLFFYFIIYPNKIRKILKLEIIISPKFFNFKLYYWYINQFEIKALMSRYLWRTVRTYKEQLIFFVENWCPLYVRRTVMLIFISILFEKKIEKFSMRTNEFSMRTNELTIQKLNHTFRNRNN